MPDAAHSAARIEQPSSPLAMADAQTDGASMTRDAWITHLAALGIDIGPVFQAIERIATGDVSRARLDSAMLGGFLRSSSRTSWTISTSRWATVWSSSGE